MPSPFVGIQIGPITFADEGVEPVLDILVEKGAVNALMVASHTFSPSTNGRAPQDWHPGHGSREPYVPMGGAYFAPNSERYANTFLPPLRAADPETAGMDVYEAIMEPAKARGLAVYAWIFENPTHLVAGHFPNLVKVSEIDIYGRRGRLPCYHNPDYRNWYLSVVEDHITSYPLDGVMWGMERRGPLPTLLVPVANRPALPPTCFCPYCCAHARDAGTSVERARRGMTELWELTELTRKPNFQRPTDGYLVTLLRLLLRYPEILAWENLWVEGYRTLMKEIYGLVKAIDPEKPVGWHIWHHNSFSPLVRAETDYADLKHYSDYLKVVLYHDCAGPRFHNYIYSASKSLFPDFTPEETYRLYSRVLNLEEAPLEKLPTSGFTAEYVGRETARAVEGVDGTVPIYPGIGIDIPVGPGQKRTRPEDVRRAIEAARAAGAQGVILSRQYSEMHLPNLEAAGQALREWAAARV